MGRQRDPNRDKAQAQWGPVSLHTDKDFKEAGALWGGSQSFVRAIVDSWDIPKIIIENRDYRRWDEYSKAITDFVYEFVEYSLAQPDSK